MTRKAGIPNVATLATKVESLESGMTDIKTLLTQIISGGVPATPISSIPVTPTVEVEAVEVEAVETPQFNPNPTALVQPTIQAPSKLVQRPDWVIGSNQVELVITFPIGSLEASTSQSGNIVYRMLNKTFQDAILATDQFGYSYNMTNGSRNGMPALQIVTPDFKGVSEAIWKQNGINQLFSK